MEMIKTSTERVRKFRERQRQHQKIRNQHGGRRSGSGRRRGAKTPKTSSERTREHRQRIKVNRERLFENNCSLHENIIIDKVLFDTETFIQEIEKFQCIWDNSSPLYTSATEKAKAWETIARNIFPTHLEKTVEEQKAMLIILKRRWKSIRDSYRKELKYQSEKKFGLETKFRKVYIFYDLLKFLKPIMSESAVAEDEREDDDGIDNTLDDIEGNELSSAETYLEKQSRILKRKLPSTKSFAKETFYTILAESIKQKERSETNQNDEDALFMLSLVKDIKRVPENLKLQFKAEFMSKFSELVQKYTYFPTAVPCSYTATPLTPISTSSSAPGNGAEYKIDVQGINVQYLQPHGFSSDGQ